MVETSFDEKKTGYAPAEQGSGPILSSSSSSTENRYEPSYPVSGHYYGEMIVPDPGRSALDLRVDIDAHHAHSPVMHRVSGDIYQLYNSPLEGEKAVYQESWVVDTPAVKWSSCEVVIEGSVRYYRSEYPPINVRIIIPWSSQGIGQAEVTFTTVGTSTHTVYCCNKVCDAFRSVTLEVDVCQSMNKPPLLPSYDTHAHSHRPADLPKWNLTIEEAYNSAGIAMTVNPTHSIIDDSTNPVWNNAELHDAMETYFSQYPGIWPKWHVWCLLASSHELPGVAGIMFDWSVKPPGRQGIAVFRNHPWFADLPSSALAHETEAAAMRTFLFCYVHEIGHAFNLLHSWQKSRANPPQRDRPDALSWMNYPYRYDHRNGLNAFWSNFCFRFDDEELIHLRHGDRNTVILGGEPLVEGAALSTIPEVTEGPIQFLVRSKGYFHFMEPVILELKVKNVSDTPMSLATELNPEFGGVLLHIQRPDGHTMIYEPLLCKMGEPEIRELPPGGRHCQNIQVSFGRHGHYFDEPGLYRIRAVYQGLGEVFIPSDIHHVRIGYPLSREEDRAAQTFYSQITGMALYLGGSDSPFLKAGMDYLRTMAEKFQESPVGAHLSLILAQNLAHPFHRITDGKRFIYRQANPEEALVLTNRAAKQHEQDETTFQNITYHHLARTKATLLATLGRKREAVQELKELIEYLGGRGVKRDILDEINAYAKKLTL